MTCWYKKDMLLNTLEAREIKKKPYKKYKEFRQGVYKPVNSMKFKGAKHPRYLSSWELKFFKWCDRNPYVVQWSSESVHIPYMSPVDGKMHRYLVDNTVHIREGDKLVKYLIEIKPSKQTRPPSQHGNKKRSTMIYEAAQWGVNQAKWDSARRWANKNGYIFQIVTEKDFNLFTR